MAYQAFYSDQNIPEGGWFDAQVDVTDLVPGYRMFFESNYDGALAFFSQQKDTDIRYWMGYAKTVTARAQVQTLDPHDKVAEVKSISLKKALDLLGYEANLKDDFILPENLEQRKLFCWALSEWSQLELISHAVTTQCYQFIHQQLVKAKVQLLTFVYDVYHWKVFWPVELNRLFQLTESEDLRLKYSEVPQPQALPGATEEQFPPLVDFLLSAITPITISSSQDIYDSFHKLCLLRTLSQKEKFKSGKYFAAAQKQFPQFDLAYLFHGVFLFAQPSFALSIKYYEKTIALNSKNAIAFNNIGLAYQNDKDNAALNSARRQELALQNFKQAITLNPLYSQFYGNQGKSYKETNSHKLAIESTLTAVNLDDTYTAPDVASIMDQFLNLKADESSVLIKQVAALLKANSESYLKIFNKYKNQYQVELMEGLIDSFANRYSQTVSFVARNQKIFDDGLLHLLTQSIEFYLNQAAFQQIKNELSVNPSIVAWDLYIHS